VLEHIERVAEDVIDWNDFWDYRRLLELYSLLEPSLLPAAIAKGLLSHDFDVKEAAEDFQNAEYVELIRRNLWGGLTKTHPELRGIAERQNVQDVDER